AGFAVLGGLNVLNPDALIARVNLDRPSTARPVDIAYLFSLSADAVPILVEALPTLAADQGRAGAERIVERWLSPTRRDWRTFNAGRDAASEAANRNRARLFEMASPTSRR